MSEPGTKVVNATLETNPYWLLAFNALKGVMEGLLEGLKLHFSGEELVSARNKLLTSAPGQCEFSLPSPFFPIQSSQAGLPNPVF